MTEQNRAENLLLELQKGADAMKAARLCLGAGLWDDAVSRAYYAAFHHVTALLLKEGLEARTHAGVHDLLYLHFVRSGRFPSSEAKLFSGLQRFREQADYARAYRFDEAGARAEVTNAGAICAAATSAIGDVPGAA